MPITALYERLSKDVGTPGESVSIRNQREYLETYAARNGHIPFTHFSDDGYSGTTFRRPAFRNMIRMIEKGEVDTVIVRDLSRFGRNYREAGFYLEKIFPAYHVRFIAVLNQVDTGENQNDFSIPLSVPPEEKWLPPSKQRRSAHQCDPPVRFSLRSQGPKQLADR